MLVYIVVPQGVGYQSPVGVFYERAQAEQAAKECWEASDGYHDLVIMERKVGVLYDSYSRAWYSGKTRTSGPYTPQFVPESDTKRGLC